MTGSDYLNNTQDEAEESSFEPIQIPVVSSSKESFAESQESFVEKCISYQETDEGKRIFIYESHAAAEDTVRLIDYLGYISRGDSPPFYQKTWTRTGKVSIECDRAGKLFLRCLNVDIERIRRNFPFHQMNPCLEVFFNGVNEFGIHGLPLGLDGLSPAEIALEVGYLNEFVEWLRRRMQSDEFVKSVMNFRRSGRKNYRSLVRYINGMFERYSRLLVIRIDLGYGAAFCTKLEGGPVLAPESVKSHWAEFIRTVNVEALNGSMVGYAWKLEYGPEKSYHYHVLLLIDSSVERNDIGLARKVGEYWKGVITNGIGGYWNCNLAKETYALPALGQVHWSDELKREGLRKIAAYMTKGDLFIKMIVPRGGRTFGKGCLPRSPKSNRGRPRRESRFGIVRPTANGKREGREEGFALI